MSINIYLWIESRDASGDWVLVDDPQAPSAGDDGSDLEHPLFLDLDQNRMFRNVLVALAEAPPPEFDVAAPKCGRGFPPELSRASATFLKEFDAEAHCFAGWIDLEVLFGLDWCETGPLGALVAKLRDKPAREIKFTTEIEARITQLACSKPPEGAARWTLRLLAGHLVEIEVIESISHTTVGLVLKKRAQTLAAGKLVHSAQANRRLRSGHGRRSGGLSQASRRQPALGLSQ